MAKKQKQSAIAVASKALKTSEVAIEKATQAEGLAGKVKNKAMHLENSLESIEERIDAIELVDCTETDKEIIRIKAKLDVDKEHDEKAKKAIFDILNEHPWQKSIDRQNICINERLDKISSKMTETQEKVKGTLERFESLMDWMSKFFKRVFIGLCVSGMIGLVKWLFFG